MIYPWKGQVPQIHPTAHLVPDCTVIGSVTLGEHSSVWHQAVLRGDINSITVGSYSNIQDNACVHVEQESPVKIGDYVTVGHGAVVHACIIGNRVLIGINSVILDGAVIEDECIIAAGAVVSPGTRVKKGSLVMGVPGRVVRDVGDSGIGRINHHAESYAGLTQEAKNQGNP